jgi:hypothetical protein
VLREDVKVTRQELDAKLHAGEISPCDHLEGLMQLRTKPPQLAIGDDGELSVYYELLGYPFSIPAEVLDLLFSEEHAALVRAFYDKNLLELAAAKLDAQERMAAAREYRFEWN